MFKGDFLLGGDIWHLELVPSDSYILIDRTGRITLGVTDPDTMTVYLSDELSVDMRSRVLIHELGHCAIFSFDLLTDIHRMTKPEHWIEMEEWVCNFIADYGQVIFDSAYSLLGTEAWTIIPKNLEVIF